MKELFWLAALLLLYTYLGYPMVLFVLGRLFGKRPALAEITPRMTLLISAYNEESVIAEKLENSLALEYLREQLEIVVASESTDRTNDIVRSYAAQGVKLFVPPGPRRGKPATLFAAVPQTSGGIIVFTDANGMCRSDALKKLVRNFADPRVGSVSGCLQYVRDPHESSGKTEGVYWRYEMWIKRLESALFCLLGANGSLFAIRRDLYAPLGESRGDDFELPVRILLRGAGSVLEPEAVSLEETGKTVGTEFTRHLRSVAWVGKSMALLAREALRRRRFFVLFQMFSHKLLRWLTLIFLGVALFATARLHAPVYRVALALQAVFYGVSALCWALDGRRIRLPRIVLVPYYFCAIHLAALIGLAQSFNSPAFQTWKKVR
jgi:cellulose synthase/poly-beta-1,6-N-acetylglucosamine synthase-like glycosyltransferase